MLRIPLSCQTLLTGADSPLRRFAQRYTYDGLDQIALRDLGLGRYNRNQAEAHARGYSGPTAPMPPPADSAPPTSSLQSQATFQPPTPLNAPGNSAPPAIPPHMAASGAPIPPNMAGPGPGPVGGNKRPLGGAPGSQSPSRSHGLARPRGSMERSSSPSRMGMGMGMGYPGAPPPGGGPMPGERENFVPNKRYRANSPRRNDRDRRGGNQGQGQGQGRDRTPLGGAPGPGPVARNLSGAGPGPGAGYGYVPREGYDRSGVGRALAWFVGELPSARSFDGTLPFITTSSDEDHGTLYTMGPVACPAPLDGDIESVADIRRSRIQIRRYRRPLQQHCPGRHTCRSWRRRRRPSTCLCRADESTDAACSDARRTRLRWTSWRRPGLRAARRTTVLGYKKLNIQGYKMYRRICISSQIAHVETRFGHR